MLEPSAFSEWLDQNTLSPRIAEILAGSLKQKEPPEIQGSGYVVKSLEPALWACYKSNNFKDRRIF